MLINKSRFAQTVVKSGKRVTTSSEAQVVALSGYNMFSTNEPLRTLLGIDKGGEFDRVVMYDFALKATAKDVADGLAANVGDVYGCDNNNERFFISKGYKIDKKAKGAKVTQNQTFTYSPIWGTILNDKLDVKELNIRDLVERGILKEFTAKRGKTAHVGLKKAFMDVVPVYVDDNGNATFENTGNPFMIDASFVGGKVMTDFNDEECTVPIYCLTNIKIEDYEPQVEDFAVAEETEETTTEDGATQEAPKNRRGKK